MTHDISKDIIAVLMNENQLGIAGIGTFTLSQQAALVTPFEGKVTPPSRKVGFNPNLKIDDGKLSRYLRDTYRLTPEAAQAKIDGFVTWLTAQISAGETVELGDLGRFSHDHKGEIRFNAGQHNFNKASFGLSEVLLSPIVRPEKIYPEVSSFSKQSSPRLSTPTASTIPPLTPVSEYAKSDALAVAWLFLRNHIWYIAAATAFLFLLGLWYLNTRDTPTQLPENPRVNTAPVTAPQEEERVNIAPRPTIEEEPFVPPTQPEIQQPEVPITTVPRTSDTRPTPPVNVAPTPPPSNTNTAIIAVGRFGQTANIEKMKQRITDAGYTPYTNLENGLTRVGVQVNYLSDDQLDRALSDIRRRFTQDAFIIKR